MRRMLPAAQYRQAADLQFALGKFMKGRDHSQEPRLHVSKHGICRLA
jgi:hypothetical protein